MIFKKSGSFWGKDETSVLSFDIS